MILFFFIKSILLSNANNLFFLSLIIFTSIIYFNYNIVVKAIFSQLNHNEYKNQEFDYKIYAALANFFAKKQGFETVFFGDEKSLKDFQNIEFNNTYRISSELSENFPKTFWSVGKLIALSLMNEPCIHIDNDLFLTRPIAYNFLQNDIYCFHDEAFVKSHEKNEKFLTKRPHQTLNYPVISYNCGIIGGQDINTIKNSINIIFDFISNSSHDLNSPKLSSNNVSVIIEQIWLFQIIKSFNKEIKTLIELKNWGNDVKLMRKKTGYIHLMDKKEDNNLKIEIERTLIKNNIKY